MPGNNRSFNGRFGYIHYQRNTKNLRFEASDLRGIEKPKAGQLVAFGFCLMAIARMYPAICFRRPTFRSSLNWENPSKPRDHCPGLVCALPDYVPEALTFRFLRQPSKTQPDEARELAGGERSLVGVDTAWDCS